LVEVKQEAQFAVMDAIAESAPASIALDSVFFSPYLCRVRGDFRLL
jgi:hypothetical protein